MNFLMHPNAAKVFRGQLAKLTVDDEDIPVNSVAANSLFRMEVNIEESDLIQENRWDERWVPPKGDRFFQLDASDEVWARPLGLGTIEKIDMGPFVVMLDSEVWDKMYSVFSDSMPMFRTNETAASAYANNCTTSDINLQNILNTKQLMDSLKYMA